jgi:diguanylate cyclase (GGDEF)-like protein/PAS domain S-box-containing protein
MPLGSGADKDIEQDMEAPLDRDADTELQALRERVRSIASTLPDVVWSVEIPSRKVIYVSPAVTEVFGKPPEQMLRDFAQWSDLIHPEDRARVLAAWDGATGGEPFEVEYRIVTPQGDIRSIQTRGRCATDADGKVVRIDGMARDVTELRIQECKIAQLSRIRAVLGAIRSAISRVHDRDDLLREACRIAVEQGSFGMVWIGLVDKACRQINVAAHHGFGQDLPGEITLPLGDDPEAKSRLGCQAVLHGRPFIDNDIDPTLPHNRLRVLAVERGYRSAIALPLLVANASIGVMILYAKEPGFFNADECILLTELASDVSLAIGRIEMEEKLKYLAHYDELTGLPNGALFHERLTGLLDEAKLAGTHTAVLVADINRFRLVNDSFGRKAGDTLLRELAVRLRAHWPEPEHVARISADSFALVLAGMQGPVEIATATERCLIAVLGAPFIVDGNEIGIAMTVGAAVFPPDGVNAETLFRNAEAAKKKAKASGDRILFYQPEMNAQVAETLLLENKLRRAIEQEQFVLHYQPKVESVTGRVTGLEALIRWCDPESGLVAPGKFISILEETGMILDAGAWAIRKALVESRDWRLTHGGPLRIAVNVSAIQLRQRDFVDTVKRAIDGLGIAATQLDLEITESMIMENVDENVKKLQAIRDMGISIAIDDFGTGYSSLAYLAKLPVNALKIDRSFVATMTTSAHSMTLISTIISLAHTLDLKVVAEGVETGEQAKLLRLLKCDEMQGYLFSQPLPAEKVQAFLR